MGLGCSMTRHTLTDEEWDQLEGLLAYDIGATDSGIHDEDLRARLRARLRDIPASVVGGEARDRFPSIAEEMVRWLSNEMGVR